MILLSKFNLFAGDNIQLKDDIITAVINGKSYMDTINSKTGIRGNWLSHFLHDERAITYRSPEIQCGYIQEVPEFNLNRKRKQLYNNYLNRARKGEIFKELKKRGIRFTHECFSQSFGRQIEGYTRYWTVSVSFGSYNYTSNVKNLPYTSILRVDLLLILL